MDDLFQKDCEDHAEIMEIARACAERLTQDERMELAHAVLGLLVG
jgi:hypothetical protein